MSGVGKDGGAMTRDTDLIRRSLLNIREISMTLEDEYGNPWVESHMIEREVAAALAALSAPVQDPPSPQPGKEVMPYAPTETDARFEASPGVTAGATGPERIWAWEIDNDAVPPNGYYAIAEVDESVEYIRADIVGKSHNSAQASVWAAEDEAPLAPQLTGRARFLRDRGEIKTPELLERAAKALTPAPVVPAEGLDSERLVAAWLAETEGFASRHERLMDDILAECDLAPWLHAACQVGIDAALRAQQPAAPVSGVTVKPLVWEDQTCGSYCWVQGLHYYTEGSDEDRDWYVSCMIYDEDVWQGENQATRDECKALAQADYEARILAALLPAGEGE